MNSILLSKSDSINALNELLVGIIIKSHYNQILMS